MQTPRNRVDFVIISLSILILMGSIYLQFNDSLLDESFLNSKTKALGKVSLVDNDVRRRLQTDLSWAPLEKSRRIYEGDSVFTGIDSKVRIELNQGDLIEVDEQSLIVIHTGTDGLELNLAYGGFSGVLSSNQKLILRDGDKAQSLRTENSEIRVTRTKRTKPRIQVLSGKVDLVDTQTQAVVQTLTQTSPPVEEKTITLEEPTKPLEWVMPKSGQILFRDLNPRIKDPAVAFAWKDSLVHPLYQLQIATDSEFQNLVIDTKLKETHFQTVQLQNASVYYSRVRPLVDEKQAAPWSDTQKFEIEHFQSFELPEKPSYVFTVPLNQAVLTSQNQALAQSGLPAKNLKTMTWKKISSATEYEIEISDNKEFLKSSKQKVANTNLYQLEFIRPQEIYWRVKPLISGSTEAPYIHGDHWRVQFSPPNLKYSKDKMEFNWSPLLFASSYELQFSSTKQFSKPRSLVTASLKHSKETTDRQNGFWRIRALNQEKKPISDFSEAIEIKMPEVISAPPPTLAAKPAEPPTPPPVSKFFGPELLEPRDKANVIALGDSKVFLNFKWKPNAAFLKFEFEISEDSSFSKKMISGFVKRPMYFMKAHELKAGTYFWRVRMVTKEATSEWSQVHEFTLR